MTEEFRGSRVFDKRNRWIINSIMAIAALAFIALLFLPFIGAFQENSRLAGSTPVSPSATPAARRAELEDQARGYEAVLQREPENQTALRGLLEANLQLGNVEGVIPPLEKLAELNPEQADYAILLAQVKQQAGDREGAAEAYRNILTTQPGNPRALQGLVSLLLEQDRPQAAIGLLQDTLRNADEANKIQPGSVDVNTVRVLLGGVYADLERYDEAIGVYDQVIDSNQQDFRPVLGKAMVLQRQGKQEEADPLFASAASLAPPEFKDQISQIAAGQSPTAPTAPTAPELTPTESAPAEPDTETDTEAPASEPSP
jgi:tetratricopeptide (TPR) repeat protein